jgi:hypothetical protein
VKKPSFAALASGLTDSLLQQCHLSIRIADASVTFALLHKPSNTYIGLYHYHILQGKTPAEEMIPIVDSITNIDINSMNKSIVLSTGRWSLVPDELLINDKKEQYFSLIHEISANEVVVSESIEALQGNNLFPLSTKLQETLQQVFPDVSVVHEISVLLKTLLKNNPAHKTSLFVHLRQSTYDVIMLEGKNLRFANSFYFENTEAFMYYLMSVLNKHNLHPHKQKVFLLGDISQHSQLFAYLNKYIASPELIEKPVDFILDECLNEIEYHHYYSLFKLFYCE